MDPLLAARDMRKHPTDEERKLWHALRRKALGVKFRRQHPIGPFVADFYCAALKLVVELDGGHHVGSADDATRDAWLRREGYEVVRYQNPEVRRNLYGVLVDLERRVAAGRGVPSPASSRP